MEQSIPPEEDIIQFPAAFRIGTFPFSAVFINAPCIRIPNSRMTVIPSPDDGCRTFRKSGRTTVNQRMTVESAQFIPHPAHGFIPESVIRFFRNPVPEMSAFRINEFRASHITQIQGCAPAVLVHPVAVNSAVIHLGDMHAPVLTRRTGGAPDRRKSDQRIAGKQLQTLPVNSGFAVCGEYNAGIHIVQFAATYFIAFKGKFLFQIVHIIFTGLRIVCGARHTAVGMNSFVDSIEFRPVENAAGFPDRIATEKIFPRQRQRS